MQDGHLSDLATPCLVLDEARLERNVARMARHVRGLGVTLRPHMKTAKSIDVARRVVPSGQGPIAVSTLKEAEYFARHGFRDILYAVGIEPGKFARMSALRRQGCDLCVVVDAPAMAKALGEHAAAEGERPAVLIEIDADGHRSGILPKASELPETAALLAAGGCEVRGVMSHAGSSYDVPEPDAIAATGRNEAAAAAFAASRLRDAGFAAPVVSIGSTPGALALDAAPGINEIRAGVYMAFDLVMAGLGVCEVDDIAFTVLAAVIGHQRDKGWIVTDAGWMALSPDRGTARLPVDQGYGVVCDLEGRPYPDLIVRATNQEHGILALRPGSRSSLPDLPVGTRIRILPNHACATAAQHDRYHVLSEAGTVTAVWPRINGW
jgi:D-serine deaminase-like pyridoxal phosphate-dependent protein